MKRQSRNRQRAHEPPATTSPRTPAWVWVILWLIIIATLGQATAGHGSEGNGPHDDGCANGVAQMGCFP